MNPSSTYCAAVARAIYELDRCCFGGPQIGQDKHDWDEARKLLFAILDRNGYEFSTCGSKRIRKTKRPWKARATRKP